MIGPSLAPNRNVKRGRGDSEPHQVDDSLAPAASTHDEVDPRNRPAARARDAGFERGRCPSCTYSGWSSSSDQRSSERTLAQATRAYDQGMRRAGLMLFLISIAAGVASL